MSLFNDAVCAEHLSGMVKYKTLSKPGGIGVDYTDFYGLHEYLEKTYPNVHRVMKREVIGTAGLLYTWKGTGKSNMLPIMFTAHLDVVPTGDDAKWNYPPYSGTIADGRLWGRGTSDCKNIIMAHMEALEKLIEEGFTPDCDIYLGYGCNEEVSGDSAPLICKTLKDRGVQLGVLLDEGSGPGPDIKEGITDTVAYTQVCEKGYVDVKVSIKDKGGHSMFPGKRCIIAELGLLANEIMQQQFPYRLTETMKNCYALKAPLMGERGKVLGNLGNDFEAAIPVIDATPEMAAMFRTTMIVTMCQGSSQANILPTEASFTINSRILPGDTIETVMDHVRSIVGDRAEVSFVKGNNPSPESRTDTPAYLCVKDVVEELHPGAVVIPSMVAGGTDAKHYYPICDTVLRFSGYCVKEDCGVHNFNEHIVIDGISRGPEFVYALFKKYCLV